MDSRILAERIRGCIAGLFFAAGVSRGWIGILRISAFYGMKIGKWSASHYSAWLLFSEIPIALGVLLLLGKRYSSTLSLTYAAIWSLFLVTGLTRGVHWSFPSILVTGQIAFELNLDEFLLATVLLVWLIRLERGQLTEAVGTGSISS